MTEQIQGQLFSMLERSFGELGFKYRADAGGGAPQIGGILKVLIPFGGGEALMEIAMSDIGAETVYMQFYTTLVSPCEKEPSMMWRGINEINFYCPVGLFGVFMDNVQFYHKYCLLFDSDAEPQAMLEDAMLAFHGILRLFRQQSPRIENITG